MFIQLLADNPTSWILPYAEELKSKLENLGHKVNLIHKHDEVIKGDVLVLLSCERKFSNLNFNQHNLVIHESNLPKGKGWSPLTWQILEGKNKIPVTLFEASDEIDSGHVYLKKNIFLEGHELLEEIKHLQGIATIELVMEFIGKHVSVSGKPQIGISSYYPRRKPVDSQLDINKSLAEQFNLLRVCDNERYPAWFEIRGHKYLIKISKA